MRLFSKKILLPLLVGSLLLTGCSSNKIQEQKKTVYAMDTIMDLTAYTDNSDVLNDAEKKINEIDKELRRGSQESEIYAVNNNEETKLTDETAYIVETALNIGKKTRGAFDITIAPVMDLWGFYNQNFYVPPDVITALSDTFTPPTYLFWSKGSCIATFQRLPSGFVPKV